MRVIGGWQFNTNTIIQSGLPFNVTYRDAGRRIATPAQPAESDRRSRGAEDPGSVVQHRADRRHPAAHSAAPRAGTFGDLPRNSLRGPGYWRTDASLFKHFRSAPAADVELRIEVVNLFNHVNLGNPDSEVGVPGNANTNAGRINSTAFGNADPQRNLQFAAKFRF